MIDPKTLVDATAVAVPAPFWFIQFFKVLGFTLHSVPMSLWYAGLFSALWLHLRGDRHGRHFAARLLQQMPVIVALGINLGIVPLLFLQLAYHKVFYPATILMAWAWFAIIVLLIPAYYGVYAYAWGIRNGAKSIATWRIAAGWIAALLFVAIGFIFANGLCLMDHVQRWPDLWTEHSHAGAALGTALNFGDSALWGRWPLMFGLALCTTAVWLLVDVFWLSNNAEDEAYRAWAVCLAAKLYTVGMIVAAAAGTWYVFGAWPAELREQMFQWPLLPLTVLTAVATGLPWMLIIALRWFRWNRVAVAAIAMCQFGVLAINAISRQVVQNLRLKEFLDVATQPVEVQWSPLAMFLVVFILGLSVVAWMLVQIFKSRTQKGSS